MGRKLPEKPTNPNCNPRTTSGDNIGKSLLKLDQNSKTHSLQHSTPITLAENKEDQRDKDKITNADIADTVMKISDTCTDTLLNAEQDCSQNKHKTMESTIMSSQKQTRSEMTKMSIVLQC